MPQANLAKSWEILVTENVKDEVEKLSGDKDLSFDFEQIDFVPPGAKRAYKVSF